MSTEDVCDLLCLDLSRGEELRRSLPEAAVLGRSAETARAFGEPTRLALAWTLREGGELCVCDLAWVSGRPEKLVSHHLRQLRQAGLVTSRKEGRMVLYALTGAGRGALETFLPAAAAAVS